MTPPPAAAQALRSSTLAPGRPVAPAPRPRRVSGPAKRRPALAPERRGVPQEGGVVVGVLDAVQRVSRHRALDRLIRGRMWIAIVAFALIGIVTLQLGLLKLNAGIGRSLERSALLQNENAALSIENSELAAGNRVEATAAHMGMQLVSPGTLRFLTARPHGDAAQAAAALATPAHTASTGTEASSLSTPSASESSTSEPPSSESSTATTPGSTPTASPTPSPEAEASSATAPAPSAASTESSTTGGGEPTSSSPGSTSPAPTVGASVGASAETTPAGGTQSSPTG